MSWVSPIDVIADEQTEQQENAIMCKVQMYVDVDKDELIKALAYDRGQYEKGYSEGYAEGRSDGRQEIIEWVEGAIKWCNPEEWGTPDERWRPESEFMAILKALTGRFSEEE